jgi:hypothetical protein
MIKLSVHGLLEKKVRSYLGKRALTDWLRSPLSPESMKAMG